MRTEKNLSAALLRLASAYIEQLDWVSCPDRYDQPHTLFYIDPPYWETEGHGVDWREDQYELMALNCADQRKAIISLLNDHPDIPRFFEGFGMESLPTVGDGANRAERQELILTAGTERAEPAGLV